MRPSPRPNPGIRALLLASLVLIPTVATAQGGGGRSSSTRRTELFDRNADRPSGPTLRRGDIEDLNPVNLLVDKRKALKLSDAQLEELKTSDKTVKDQTAPFLKQIDSLVRAMKMPGGNTPSAEDRVRMRDAGFALKEVIDHIRSAYDSSATQALALMDAEQKDKANELLAKQREKGEKAIQEKLRMGGGPGRSNEP